MRCDLSCRICQATAEIPCRQRGSLRRTGGALCEQPSEEGQNTIIRIIRESATYAHTHTLRMPLLSTILGVPNYKHSIFIM